MPESTASTATPAAEALSSTPPSTAESPSSTTPSKGGSPTILASAEASTITDWRAELPEDIRDAANLATFKGVPELAQAYVEAQKLIGKKGLQVPKDDAPKDVWDNVWKSLGRPDKPDGYEVKVPEGLPVSEEEIGHWKAQIHELGLTAKQGSELITGYLAREADRAAQAKANADFQLRKEWGGRFDENLAVARRTAEFAGVEFAEALSYSPLGNSPAVLKALHRLGQELINDPTGSGATRSHLTGLTTTVEQARTKLQEKQGDGAWVEALYDRQKPGHARAKAEYDQLIDIIARGNG